MKNLEQQKQELKNLLKKRISLLERKKNILLERKRLRAGNLNQQKEGQPKSQ